MTPPARAHVREHCVAAHKNSSAIYTEAVDLAMAALDGTVNSSIAKLKLLELGYDLERAGDSMRADCVRRLIKRLAT